MRAHLACRAPAARLWKERPTGPLIVAENSCTRTAEARPQLLVLACRRVCWALPGRHRAGGRTRRCVLKMTRWELTTWVVFVAVSAVWRLEARRASRFGLSYTCQGVGCR